MTGPARWVSRRLCTRDIHRAEPGACCVAAHDGQWSRSSEPDSTAVRRVGAAVFRCVAPVVTAVLFVLTE